MKDLLDGTSYPRELRKLLKDRGIETDGYGLIDGSWGMPLLFSDPNVTILAHRVIGGWHWWAASFCPPGDGKVWKLCVLDSQIGVEVRGRPDWNFDAARRQVAEIAERVETGKLPKPNVEELSPIFAEFHRLHEEWRNHFGYLSASVGRSYSEKDLQSGARKVAVEAEMDAIKLQIGQKLRSLPETG